MQPFNPNPTDQKLLYVYDLPKNEFTSTKLAEYIKDVCGFELTRKPQVRRDPARPFYSAILSIPDGDHFKKACEKLRYFEMGGKPCRALPFDNQLLGANAKDLAPQNVFVRVIPKDKTAPQLEEFFLQYGPVKSLKISLDSDYKSRGYGFVCYQDPESAAKALEERSGVSEMETIPYQPRDRIAMRKVFNNIYVKNLPPDFSVEEVQNLFNPYGRIASLKVEKNEMGQYAFICYMSEDKQNREYGPECASRAIEALNGKDMGLGDKKKLVVKEALSSQDREVEKQRDTLKYKNSKKRCNLYVKGFPPTFTEDDLKNIFEQHGQIEKLKMFPASAEKLYAFVCFTTPDSASQAKSQLNGKQLSGSPRPLYINFYEIKEYRDLQNEENKDKQDFQQYRMQTAAPTQWGDLYNKDDLLIQLQQLMVNFPRIFNNQQQNRGRPQNNYGQNNMRPQGGQMQNRPQNNMGGNKPHYQQNRGNYHNQNPGMQQHPQNQGHMQPMPAQMPQPKALQSMPQPKAAMPQPVHPGMPAPGQPQPVGQVAPPQLSPEEQEYRAKAGQIIASINSENPVYKTTVGTCIYPFVAKIAGQDKAPKITGMLIDQPIPIIHAYLQSLQNLVKLVNEAEVLLTKMVQTPQPQPAAE